MKREREIGERFAIVSRWATKGGSKIQPKIRRTWPPFLPGQKLSPPPPPPPLLLDERKIPLVRLGLSPNNSAVPPRSFVHGSLILIRNSNGNVSRRAILPNRVSISNGKRQLFLSFDLWDKKEEKGPSLTYLSECSLIQQNVSRVVTL